MESINVYIDGACSKNGHKDAIAGYGVFFEQNDSRNESGLVEGKQSNNTGELTAFIRCLEILENDIKLNKNINIYTDSEYVIKCATNYGKKLELKEWKSDKEIPNLELVKKAYILFKNTKNVSLNYIKAHTTNTDIHSKGNSEADKLANSAANIFYNILDTPKKELIKLDIAYNNKEKAKKMGAKWNIKGKYWYIESENITDELIALQNDTSEKTYLNVPFAEKDYVKKLGAKWDTGSKKWFYIDKDMTKDKIELLSKYKL